jgi:hypothetical protein
MGAIRRGRDAGLLRGPSLLHERSVEGGRRDLCG